MFLLIASCAVGWLIATVACIAAWEFRQEIWCLRGANDAAKRCIKELEDQNRDWANRNGRYANRASVLFQGLSDVVARARKAMDEQEAVK